jgi:hypothetical protein
VGPHAPSALDRALEGKPAEIVTVMAHAANIIPAFWSNIPPASSAAESFKSVKFIKRHKITEGEPMNKKVEIVEIGPRDGIICRSSLFRPSGRRNYRQAR